MYNSILKPGEDFKVSFGYQCRRDVDCGYDIPSGDKKIQRTNSSFSCLSGAAIGANYTYANTNICNGVIASEILPTLDSPKSFRRIPSSSSFTKLDLLSSSLQSSMSALSCSPSTPSGTPESDPFSLKSMSDPSRNEGFLNAVEIEVAGGAAGEDRVQAVCSEENGWLFCAIYDGIDGRDAADYLAGTFYETIRFYLNNTLDLDFDSVKSFELALNVSHKYDFDIGVTLPKNRVLDCLQRAISQAENDFLNMVEQEMDDRPDIVAVGSCVLSVLLYAKDLYVLNLGNSRAVLATVDEDTKSLTAVQLAENHTVENDAEIARLLSEHPDDPETFSRGKIKGRLKVTRAFGVGYMKKKNLNDTGILRVRNLLSPPYISVQPSLVAHEISSFDHFVVLGSNAFFDFFSNDEVVRFVHTYISRHPRGDPAKYLLEIFVLRAAGMAGFETTQDLMTVPAGPRRKYHDDVTVIVIILGTNKRTSKASTCDPSCFPGPKFCFR